MKRNRMDMPARPTPREPQKWNSAFSAGQWNLLQILFGLLSVFSLVIGGMIVFYSGWPPVPAGRALSVEQWHELLLKKGWENIPSGGLLVCLAAIAAFNLLLWGGRWSGGRLPVIRIERNRMYLWLVLFLGVGCWELFCANIVIPRQHLTDWQTVVWACWGMLTPMGAVAGPMWGLETAARKKTAPPGA